MTSLITNLKTWGPAPLQYNTYPLERIPTLPLRSLAQEEDARRLEEEEMLKADAAKRKVWMPILWFHSQPIRMANALRFAHWLL
jgi:hypothetical protein